MNISGSLQTKKGVYYTVLWVNGKYQWKTTRIRTEAKTKREEAANLVKAQGVLAQRIQDAEQERVDICNSMFIDYLCDWLERKSQSIRRCTAEGYEIYLNNHIKPYYEPLKLKLTDVTPMAIQKYVDYEYKNGSSPNSIKKYMVVINSALDDAVMYNFIQFNPAKRIKMYKTVKPNTKAYSIEETLTLIDKVRGVPIESAVLLALYLGLRRSEVAGLRWRDIDMDKRIVSVRNTVVKMKSTVEGEQTKSKASRRDMRIPDGLYIYLSELKDKSRCDYVCSFDDGRRFSPDYITSSFSSFLKKNGLPHIRFHELRHTCGSILFNSGATVKQVQDYLGHERASTTMDLYVHLDTISKIETSNMISNILHGD